MEKSNVPQSTLFQTWGYYDKQKEHEVTVSNGKKSLKNGPSTDQIIGNNDGDLLEMFSNDADLLDVVDSMNQDVFLDSKKYPKTTPEHLHGFDEEFGTTYIYPTNYPIRDYQFHIAKKALIENSLVVLPTGLGKTFIAAVVMFNFYRWYPNGKVIFMAPTKPLVAQQIEACYNIMGIPQDITIEMTGSLSPHKRESLWKTKRVFFLTPQVLQNDLSRGICFPSEVVCLVFDEAHRALGNHAYCQVIKEIMRYRSNFRVLAMTASPGSDMKAVQHVVDNLLISHIEIRSEDSIDIHKYVQHRSVEKIVVPISGYLKEVQDLFIGVLRGVVKRLVSKKALWNDDAEKLSKFFLLKAREQWRANNPNTSDKVLIGVIEGDFGLAMSLYHAYELLQQHGLLSFYNFLKGVLSGSKGTSRSRMELLKNPSFMEMMETLHSQIEPDDENFNESITTPRKQLQPKQRLLKSIPKPCKNFNSHPKLEKLQEIVLEHFSKHRELNPENVPATQTPLNTRVMIFSQYRDSVQEITAMLSNHEPLVKVMSFIGQGCKEGSSGVNSRGLSQKEQIEVLRKFRTGGYNTIVSTSVGEEGLDIGDVDLIVCFDVSSSPIRLVQRMGRTGRKRSGRIVILVAEGKEETIYKRSLNNKKCVYKNLCIAQKSLRLYEESHRMIPKHIDPKCHKMNIAVGEYKKNKKSTKRAVQTTAKLLQGKENNDSCTKCTELQTETKSSKKQLKVSRSRQMKKSLLSQRNKFKTKNVVHVSDSDEEVSGQEDKMKENLYKEIFGSDETLKSCPLMDSCHSHGKLIPRPRRRRFRKLPPLKPCTFDDVEDNQLDFCSQVTMPTLFNRCQEKRRNSSQNDDDVESPLMNSSERKVNNLLDDVGDDLPVKCSLESIFLSTPKDDQDKELDANISQLITVIKHKTEFDFFEEDLELNEDGILNLLVDVDIPSSPNMLSQKTDNVSRYVNTSQMIEQKQESTNESEDSPVLIKKKKKVNIIEESQDDSREMSHVASPSRKCLKRFLETSSSEEDKIKKKERVSKKKARIELTNQKKQARYKNQYIAHEAEDVDEVSDDESEDNRCNGYVMDSFIDDATQQTPVRRKNDVQTPIDMNAVYKRSLLSPQTFGDPRLKFNTPAFHAKRNRYKLANLQEKYKNIASVESSEAEEVMGLIESDCSAEESGSSGELIRDSPTKKNFKFFDSESDEESNLGVVSITDSQLNGETFAVSPGICKTFAESELPPITFSFGIVWLNNEDSLDKDDMFNGQTNTSETIVVMDSKCVANSQIASLLRVCEKCQVVIRSQLNCDYIISRRMAALRISLSDINNSSNAWKFNEHIYQLSQYYERSAVIIERGREAKCNAYTKYYAGVLAKLTACRTKIFHATSPEETAVILGNLAKCETRNGHGIRANVNREQMLNCLLCIPSMTYPVAMEIMYHFKSIKDVIGCDLDRLLAILRHVPSQTVNDLHFFFEQSI